MAIKYSQNTAISLYKFNSESDYRTWLSANIKNSGSGGFHDIVALVKNTDMNGGYDLFVNSHSISATKVYVQTANGVKKLSDDEDSTYQLDETKQYVIKNISRKGQGEKNILMLQEVDIDSSIKSAVKNYIDSSQMSDYLDDYMESYLDSHPIKSEMYDKEKIERILTNTHYMFRKIFSLMYKERAIHLGLEMKYLNNDSSVVTPFSYFDSSQDFSKIQFRVGGVVGSDVDFNSFDIYKDDSSVAWVHIDGENIVGGWNQDIDVSENITETTTYHAVLSYTKHRLVDNAKASNIQNFDTSVSFKDKDEKVCCCYKFFKQEQKQDSSIDTSTGDDTSKGETTPVTPTPTINKGYIYFVPTDYDEDGYTKLKSPYDEIEDFETISWLSQNSITSTDINVATFNISSQEDLTYAFKIPTTENNYQIYIMLPTQLTKSVSINADGFADEVSEIVDSDAFSGVEYLLYKQDFPQTAGTQLVLNVATKF